MMVTKLKIYQIISLFLFLCLLFFILISFFDFSSNCPLIDESTCSDYIIDCPETIEKALITPYTRDWWINFYNEDEFIWEVSLFNYGYTEARNINVVCEMYLSDEEGYLISEDSIISSSRNVGNLASTSYRIVEIYGLGAKDIDDSAYLFAVCSVESCDNCDILDDRLES